MSQQKSSTKAVGRFPGINKDADWIHELKRGRVPGPRMEQNKLVGPGCGPSTKSVHAGTYVDPTTGAIGTPIFQTTAFQFNEHTYKGIAAGGALRDVPVYTRTGGPNQWTVQEKMSSLEGAESSVVFSSGMAATSTVLHALTNNGGHVITSLHVYGGSYTLFREDMHQIGRQVSFVDCTDVSKVEAAIRDNTQVIFVESLNNPLLLPVDIKALAELCRKNQVLLVVDNTYLTPVFLRPLEHGAHIVLHSGTKYLNGHNDLTCGVVSGKRKYMNVIWAESQKLGGTLDSMSCFLLERGLKTLAVRMRTHHENAMALVEFLSKHDKIKKVHHPSTDDYPHAYVRELCPDGFGGMLSFEVEGGDEAAQRLIDLLTLPIPAVNLGGLESLILAPFNTTHSALTAAQRTQAGIMPGLIRMSVGIEDKADLIDDFNRALSQL